MKRFESTAVRVGAGYGIGNRVRSHLRAGQTTEIAAALAATFDIKPRFYCSEVFFHLPLGASLSVNLVTGPRDSVQRV